MRHVMRQIEAEGYEHLGVLHQLSVGVQELVPLGLAHVVSRLSNLGGLGHEAPEHVGLNWRSGGRRRGCARRASATAALKARC